MLKSKARQFCWRAFFMWVRQVAHSNVRTVGRFFKRKNRKSNAIPIATNVAIRHPVNPSTSAKLVNIKRRPLARRAERPPLKSESRSGFSFPLACNTVSVPPMRTASPRPASGRMACEIGDAFLDVFFKPLDDSERDRVWVIFCRKSVLFA